MTIEEILKNKNCNGEVYLSDCALLLPEVDLRHLRDIQVVLTKIQKAMENHAAL